MEHKLLASTQLWFCLKLTSFIHYSIWQTLLALSKAKEFLYSAVWTKQEKSYTDNEKKEKLTTSIHNLNYTLIWMLQTAYFSYYVKSINIWCTYSLFFEYGQGFLLQKMQCIYVVACLYENYSWEIGAKIVRWY